MGVLLILASGCTIKEVRPTDEHKSCDALVFEKDSLSGNIREVPAEETSFFHYMVVGAGIGASLTPALLLSKYFYMAPALTITYYNLVFNDNQEAERQAEIQTRLKKIDTLLDEKNCTKGNH